MASKQKAPPPPEERIEIEILSGPDIGSHVGVLLSQWLLHYPDVAYRVVGPEPAPVREADETFNDPSSDPAG